MVAANPPTAMALVEAKKALPWPRLPSRGVEHAVVALGHVEHPAHALRLHGSDQAPALEPACAGDHSIDTDRQQEIGKRRQV
jgi:hypothetical protein